MPRDSRSGAALLFGSAEALIESIGLTPAPIERNYYECNVAAVRTSLGEAAFAAAWAVGRAMPLEQAIASALAMENAAASGAAPPAGAATASQRGGLTRREREVAVLLARGLTNRQLAEALVITEGTAANHVEHILTKLGFGTRAQVAAWAIEHGLVAAATP